MKNQVLKFILTHVVAIYCYTSICLAQDTSISKKDPVSFSGYIETYYSYDLANPKNHTRPSFFYSFNRHNEVNLNLGYIKAAYVRNETRANLALMAGTYAQYNLAAEQGLLQNVLEANIGVKLSKKKNLWLDAGVMPSHIGFESAIGKDCWNLTRSILADNSPYFESGIKIAYTNHNEKWYIAAMYLNGWQRIQKITGDQSPSFGTQITFKPNKNSLLNWSTFVGEEGGDSLNKGRIFNNFYGQFQLLDKLGLIAGFDIGIQQKPRTTLFIGDGFSIWYAPIAILRYQTSAKTRLAIRGEYYTDPDEVIVTTALARGFKTTGYSVNFDYYINTNTLFRLEARTLRSKEKVFELYGKPSGENYFFTSSLSLSF